MAVLGLVLCTITAATTAAGSAAQYAWLEAMARSLMVGLPIAVGLYARRRPPFERFGALLIVGGFLWFLTTLAAAESELPYTIGRVFGWVVEAWLVIVVLAFPSGRLTTRIDRVLAGAIVLLVAVLFLPTALLVEAYPVPNAWATCDPGRCPGNAFLVLDSEPAFVADVLQPVRDLLAAVIFAAVTARLAYRVHRASWLSRRTLAPVLAVAIARLALYPAAIVLRLVAPRSHVLEVCAWLIALAVPAMAVALLVGLIRWHLFTAVGMQRLAVRLSNRRGPEDLRAALADAFEDPTLEVAYRMDDRHGWVDGDGGRSRRPCQGRAAASPRSSTMGARWRRSSMTPPCVGTGRSSTARRPMRW